MRVDRVKKIHKSVFGEESRVVVSVGRIEVLSDSGSVVLRHGEHEYNLAIRSGGREVSESGTSFNDEWVGLSSVFHWKTGGYGDMMMILFNNGLVFGILKLVYEVSSALSLDPLFMVAVFFAPVVMFSIWCSKKILEAFL